MRVAVFNGPSRPITIERVADPRPDPDELLVKIGRCGICGSDLAMTSEGPFAYPAGFRLGHEYAGEVVESGHAVSGVKSGDRVACIPSAGCGECSACREGLFIRCSSAKALFGGFGDYVVVPRKSAVLLPRSLSPSDGALIEPMACGLHALHMAGMRGGAHILVLGAGSIALAIVYWARRLGADTITVVSRSAHRRDVILAMGADSFHRFDDDFSGGLAGKDGGMPDIVAECIGKVGMLNKAIDRVRPGGTVLSMGMCAQSESIVAARCTFKEVKMLFPLAYSLGEFVETAKAFESGHVRPELMVSDVIALDDLPATIEAMRQGRESLKILVNPNLEAAHV